MTGFGGTAYVGSDGAYVMAGLRPGDYVFQLDDSPRWQNPAKRRFAPDALAFADATVFTMAAGRARTVDFAVDHGFVNSDAVAVRGLVSAGDTGRPVAGAEVRITPNRQWVGAESYVTQTAEDGMYEIEVWNSYPGTTVSVTAPAGYAGGARVLDLGFRDTGTRVDFALGRLPTTTAPTLSSTVRVGVATRATVSGWTSGMTLSYQWKRNGKSISGATRSSYTPVAADRGQRLTVTVGGKRSGYVTTSRTSSSRTVGYGILSLPTPKISGTRKVGATLTAVRGAGISGAAYSYQWYSQRTAISGATRSKRTLTWREGGDRITVKVTVRKPGYTTLSKTSSMTARIAW